MKRIINTVFFLILILALLQCEPADNLSVSFESLPSQVGKTAYLDSPYVTAGDRLYMVGHQNGSFPDLGWHVEGEMAGIWDHPIKLMDGFAIAVGENDANNKLCLDDADQFVNYPVGNRHIFNINNGEALEITRTQFIPDGIEGIVIELSLRNQSIRDKTLDIDFTGMIDLMPVWLSDSLGIEDGTDRVQWDESRQVYVATDSNNSWFTVFGSSNEITDKSTGTTLCSFDRRGKGLDATITTGIRLEAETTKKLQYFIAGSFESREDAMENYVKVSSQPGGLLQNKIKRYNKLKETSQLSIPDKEIEEMYTWLKYNADWLIRDVEGVGRGLSAGIPDYPWWFSADNAYALQGLLVTGRHEEVLSTVGLLYDLSNKVNGNGRVIHEASTNGVVFNKGNMNETPHMIYLLWKIYEWTGDKQVLNDHYDEVVAGLEFLLNERDPDGNLYPNGHGMMEIQGLDTEMIDVAVYTQQALGAAAKMAAELGKDKDQKKYQELAGHLKQKINTEWWVDDFNSYADFRATKSQALALIDDAIVRADTLNKPWAVGELNQARKKISESDIKDKETGGYVVHHNWVVNTPMEMGIADYSKAEQALETARNYTSRFGMYVTGIDRDETREESNKWEVFSYVGAVMTLPTGVQTIAEANYGNTEESYNYLKMLSNSFGYALPGSMYEVSPDYGMIVQAWNIYAAAVPIVEHYFGIKPKAYEKQVIIRPDMPASWDRVSLKNVRIGNNTISITKNSQKNVTTFKIEQEQPDWELILQLPRQDEITVTLNGDSIEPEPVNGLIQIELNRKLNEITIGSESD